MLKIFVGIVLICFSFGDYVQFAAPFTGAVIIAYELVQNRRPGDHFNAAIVSAMVFAVYQLLSTVLSILPIYEADDLGSYLYTGRILLGTVLLLTLYIGFKRGYDRRVFGIFGLIAMHGGTAAVVLLAPVLDLQYDEITIGMAALVYAFILGYVGSDLRLMYLSEEES